MSEHFPYDSQIFSQTAIRLGIDNTPTPEHSENMKLTAAYMEAVRVLLGNNPIITSSWYRSLALNEKIPNSSKSSQHSLGQAVDFTCRHFGTPYEICKYLINTSIPFDQIIYEGNWVHISFVKTNPRRRVLTAIYTNGEVSYVTGLVEHNKA